MFAPNACGLVQFGNQRVAVFTSHVGLHGSAPSSVKHLPSREVSMQNSWGRPAIEPWRLPAVAHLFQAWLPVQ